MHLLRASRYTHKTLIVILPLVLIACSGPIESEQEAIAVASLFIQNNHDLDGSIANYKQRFGMKLETLTIRCIQSILFMKLNTMTMQMKKERSLTHILQYHPSHSMLIFTPSMVKSKT